MKKEQFIESVFKKAKSKSKIEINPAGLRQIDFGTKKLHEGHLAKLYSRLLKEGANIKDLNIKDLNIKALIEEVAPGRPCTHRPMRAIIEEITREES